VKDPEDLVFGAELRCMYGSMHNYLLTKDYVEKGINGLPAKFVVTDCVPDDNIKPFGDCYAGGSCVSQWVLDDKWINSDGQNETFGGKEIITTDSHLVCKAWGMFVVPVNSGQNTDIGKQLMLLAELDDDLLAFLMNPYNSIYTPNDISQKVLDLLGQIVNSDLYNGEIFLMAQGNNDIMGPIILACMGHLVASAGVGDPVSLLNSMEAMITRTRIQTNADPRYLNAEMLSILKVDSQWYAGEVANGGLWGLIKWQEEHKSLLSFLAEAATTAAYGAIMYASMYAGRGNQSYSNPENVKCFVAGTYVKIIDGYREIEKIVRGDFVYSKNVDTGEVGYKQVFQTFENESLKLIEIWAGAEVVNVTPEHPFFVEGKGWIEAKDILAQDVLVNIDSKLTVTKAVGIKKLDKPTKVYNIRVNDWHTYYITKSSILVHNAGPDCGPPDDVKISDLKRVPNYVIEQLGGEDYTSGAKAQGGKSGANLYWNPRTGDVYSLVNGSSYPQYVDTIPIP